MPADQAQPNQRQCSSCGTSLSPGAPAGLCSRCLLEAGLPRSAPTPASPPTAENRWEEAPGYEIDSYRLVERLGEGGMGVVWKAEQLAPIRRMVALKVIKPGMDSRQVLARFEAERQALALMNHPNIAKVFDAGTTPTGRPYFVMELVSGVRLTAFCDEQRRSIPQRLELFRDICRAIQHAHEKGVIHRDIKPENVLVTVVDGTPIPKVIDFGVAKAINQRLTERTLFTEYGQLIGTPEYMSPEQAQFNQQDIDTRSDVYSLGVLLFELATGTTPLRRETLENTPFDEILRRIREEPVPRPSTRIGQLGAQAQLVAVQRAMKASRLLGAVRGDLDWVILKALEKERTRRYATAGALADDVQRILDLEPPSPRPPNDLYTIWAFARRNRTAVAIVLMAAIASGICLRFYLRELQLREVTIRELERHKQVGAFLTGTFEDWRQSLKPGRDTVLLEDVLKRSQARVSRDLSGNPWAQADVSISLGGVCLALGDHGGAERLFRIALNVMAGLPGGTDVPAARASYGLALALDGQGKAVEAEPFYRRAVSVFELKLPGSPQLFTARAWLGAALLKLGRFVEAESLLLSGFAGMQSADSGGSEETSVILSTTAAWIVQLYEATHRPEKAAEWREKQKLIDRSTREP